MRTGIAASWLCVACGGALAAPPAPRAIALPGVPAGGVFLDYIVYDRAHHRVWVPAGSTGSVDVIDTADGHLTRVEGFPTGGVERHGEKHVVGPSAATVGEGVVYVGNRGDSTVCAVDAASLKKGACGKVGGMPDGVFYVGATHEVWVTTPRDEAIVVLDAASLAPKGKVTLPGEPEGYAVDDGRGVVYTNLEDADRTLALDAKTRAVKATWAPACGQDGPRGLALDRGRDLLVVACTDHAVVLDAGHDGAVRGRLDTGAGLDNLDYDEARHTLYAAAGKAAQLTVARLDEKGALTAVAVAPTSPGARNAVATEDGTAYVTDAREGRVLVMPAAK